MKKIIAFSAALFVFTVSYAQVGAPRGGTGTSTPAPQDPKEVTAPQPGSGPVIVANEETRPRGGTKPKTEVVAVPNDAKPKAKKNHSNGAGHGKKKGWYKNPHNPHHPQSTNPGHNRR